MKIITTKGTWNY